MNHSELIDQTPEKWTLKTFESGDNLTDPSHAVWEYDHRGIEVRIVPDSDSDPPTYVVKRENNLYESQYTAPSPGFASSVTVAHYIMRGKNGITATDLSIQVGLTGSGASEMSSWIQTWDDLVALYHDFGGDFSCIDGVGAASNERLCALVKGEFLDREDRELVRNADEGAPESVAVYAGLPAINDDLTLGWKLRKEWRDAETDNRTATVMLPTEYQRGEWYESLDAVRAAAEEMAAERTSDPECQRLDCEQPATIEFDALGDHHHWCEDCYDEPCSCGAEFDSEDNRVKGVCADCFAEVLDGSTEVSSPAEDDSGPGSQSSLTERWS